MYLLLVVFGGVLSVFGIALAAAGVSIHDRTFDTTIVTPSVIAIAGGFLLIGLGFVLRVLQRIERTLSSGQVVPAESAELSTTSINEKRFDNLPDQACTAVRCEIEAAEPSSSTAAASPSPTSVNPAVAENGAVPGYLTPRLEITLRAPSSPERRPLPKGLRPIQAAPPVPAQAASMALAKPEVSVAPAAAAVQTPAPDATPSPEPVWVLKSGVVDGMAYTLYSDGSILAELPQGTLRFGSITELRNHVEQNA